MAEETRNGNVGTVLLTFIAGAVLGAGIALAVAAQREELEHGYDEADLFV